MQTGFGIWEYIQLPGQQLIISTWTSQLYKLLPHTFTQKTVNMHMLKPNLLKPHLAGPVATAQREFQGPADLDAGRTHDMPWLVSEVYRFQDSGIKIWGSGPEFMFNVEGSGLRAYQLFRLRCTGLGGQA